MNNNPSSCCPYMADAPYPPVRAEGVNSEYAHAMLSNIGGCNSEMSAISLYFYNSLVLEPNYAQFATIYEKISVVEMHHLDIFGTLAFQLGADPRLWTCQDGQKTYWTPEYNNYPLRIRELLLNTIEAEKAAVCKYREQSKEICDKNVVENLNRVILDEECHIKIFSKMLEQVSDKCARK